MKDNHIIQEEEIDLKKVFSLLWAKKIFIVVVTLLFTFGGVAYVSFKKVIPLYEGKVLVEIGEIQSEVFGTQVLDYPENLIPVLMQQGFKATSPVRSNKIVVISKIDKDKKNIQLKLENIIQYILERHQEKAKFYKNVLKTQQIGEIKVLNTPINEVDKKSVIIFSFIGGVVLAILFVFLNQFIQKIKE
ncbi:Wzz/FepE/Etk N-terminal domain-containing protein [Candidatus Marinarcus aquaticus]|uniref:Polysaccharide chain length determinant N-terminal domain-containing protein n=1 Tax=Candidatus Marinarcus aquaticus TaxID=2044504 RepID=A0A4Q0XQI8_9BACT|nr:Wzz/FepE/Etk N-terminal domain-containing protein [Candidatus Marinarcus aquaticus]RXJ57848.1 hypothetical protein CRV04_04880 [Candidatus Marinarcus aquaticus]